MTHHHVMLDMSIFKVTTNTLLRSSVMLRDRGSKPSVRGAIVDCLEKFSDGLRTRKIWECACVRLGARSDGDQRGRAGARFAVESVRPLSAARSISVADARA